MTTNNVTTNDTPHEAKMRQASAEYSRRSMNFPNNQTTEETVKATEEAYQQAATAYGVDKEEVKVWNYFYQSRKWGTDSHKAYWETYDRMKANGEV